MSGFSNPGRGAGTSTQMDTTQIVNELQNGNQVLSAILQALKTGVLLSPSVSVYTVASLPTSAQSFAVAAASNGRKGSEGSGAGTGVPVYWNPATSQWFAFYNNSVVLS
jgi:hypothetical protein